MLYLNRNFIMLALQPQYTNAYNTNLYRYNLITQKFSHSKDYLSKEQFLHKKRCFPGLDIERRFCAYKRCILNRSLDFWPIYLPESLAKVCVKDTKASIMFLTMNSSPLLHFKILFHDPKNTSEIVLLQN